jgi:serine/threonine-protein kinase RsbW
VERLRLPAALDSIDEVVGFVAALTKAAGLSDRQGRRLRLAAEELVANIVTHGYGGCGGPARELELEGGVEPGHVWLRVTDAAPPFDPTRVAAPPDLARPLSQRRLGGLGLYLARSAADRLSYEYTAGQNQVTIYLDRADPPRERSGATPTALRLEREGGTD